MANLRQGYRFARMSGQSRVLAAFDAIPYRWYGIAALLLYVAVIAVALWEEFK